MRKILLLSLIAVLLCDSIALSYKAFIAERKVPVNNTSHYDQPKLTSRSTVSQVTVNVHWVDKESDVDKLCRKYGSRTKPGLRIVGCEVWGKGKNPLIIAKEPKDFNDTDKLEILGHEFWHALGANHE